MKYNAREIVDLGMKLADGDGCIAYNEGAYLLLNYAKDSLSVKERETYRRLKRCFEGECDEFDLTTTEEEMFFTDRDRINSNIVHFAYTESAPLRKNNVMREEVEAFIQGWQVELMSTLQEHEKEELYRALTKIVDNCREKRGPLGNHNRKPNPKTFNFSNNFAWLLGRFKLSRSQFVVKFEYYLKKKNVKYSFDTSNLPQMIGGYYKGNSYPLKENRELICAVCNDLNSKLTSSEKVLCKEIRSEDLDLQWSDFLQNVFVNKKMSPEEMARFLPSHE